MSETISISVILPAAGQSRRFGDGKKNKLEMALGGRSVLVRAVELFSGRPDVCEVIVAVPPDQLDGFKYKWGDKLSFMGAKIVAGGTVERWETVRNALAAVSTEATHVAVHDAARPLATQAMIDRIFAAMEKFDAVIPALPVTDTCKRAELEPAKPQTQSDPLDAILGSAGTVEIHAYQVLQTVPRSGLWTIQTPQTFKRELLVRAYAQIASGDIDTATITDDAGLVEALGEPVYLVEGDRGNMKITRPGDLEFAVAILASQGGSTTGEKLGPKRKFPTWAESEDE